MTIGKRFEESGCGYQCRQCRCAVGADMSKNAYPAKIQKQVDVRLCTSCAQYYKPRRQRRGDSK